MTEVERVTGASSAQEVLTIIERDGGVIIEDFLSPEAIAELKADLLPKLDAKSTGGDAFAGAQTKRMSALFAHSRRVADIVTHPLYLPVAEALINRPVVYGAGEQRRELYPGIRIGATQLIQIGPGQGAQPLHRDDMAFLWRHPAYGREARLQVMLAISDFTAENGGTLVIPGSHTWDDERVPQMSEARPTVMKSGSALLFVGSCYHAGGTNRTTDQLRTGLTIAIDAANVRQEENMYLALPRDVVASYPETIQRLLGWSSGVNHMGWVEVDGQMADPITLLN